MVAEDKTRLNDWLEMAVRLKDAPEWDGPVEMTQTHISVVLLGRDRVLKLKKPVDFGFLDYTTLEKRRLACEAEVRLNQRLCEGTYLRVQPVVLAGGVPQLCGEGPVIDYGVLMNRLPANRMLDELVRRDAVTEAMIDRVARRLREFHRDARRGPEVDSYAGIAQIRCNWDENFSQTASYVGRTICDVDFEQIRTWVEERLGSDHELFLRRIAEAKIVDGHGDVRCESICVTNGICVFDCIEFNDRFRCGDVASEVAFLAMDLDALGRPDLGYFFTERYQAGADDLDLLRLLPFYRCYRAYVRGKVLSFRLDEPEFSAAEKDRAAQRAAGYFELAQRYSSRLRRPTVIVVSGLPGTGKTSLARAVAGELGCRVVSTDAVRLELFGEQKRPAGYGEGVYGAEASQRTYRALIDKGIKRMAEDGSVILDGTFLKAPDRAEVRQIASVKGAAMREIECLLAPELVRGRIERRQRRQDGLSDATWQIYERQLEQAGSTDNRRTGGQLIRIDTSDTLVSCARRAADWLRHAD
jgi:hypothetical protein